MDEPQQFEAWLKRIWHSRVQAQLANPYTHINHVFVGRDLIDITRRNITPPPGNYPSLHGRIGALGGMDIVPDDDLQPDEWQLRNHEGSVVAHGKLTDLER